MPFASTEQQREYHKNWYKRNPRRKKALQEYNKKYIARNSKFVRRIKLYCGCSICGYKKSAFALDFHHVDPLTKENNISYLIRKTSLNNLKIEIRKCIVLCANCHRELTFSAS